MGNTITFKTTELAAQIKASGEKIKALYRENGYDEDAKKLDEVLNQSFEDEQIRVVFIGQYTAGKSTIISNLTLNKDIKIDSDIATSVATDYRWNGVILTDTPGLYTENQEHDNRTIEMIKKSDLLVYCITSDLFNQYTLQDFKKWAFEVGYAGKMFLVINKMSKEAGEYSQLTRNYTETINKSLVPYSVDGFSNSFVDAKDYKDGIEEVDLELIQYSHFEEFIMELNQFIQQKGLLGKLDTPIMLMKSAIEETLEKLEDDDTKKAGNILLSRIEKRVEKQRNKFSIEARDVISNELKNLKNRGYEISNSIGVEELDYTIDDIEEMVQETCKEINVRIEELCVSNVEVLQEEVEKIMDSNTADYFFHEISGAQIDKKTLFEKKDTKMKRIQFESIKGTVETITGKTINASIGVGKTNSTFLFRSSEVSGSTVHKVVLKVGEKVGYKFKPWEAVNIAKKIGNTAKFLGPTMIALGVIMDGKNIYDEHQIAKKIKEEKVKFRQIFLDISSDLEGQYSKELSKFFEVYETILVEIQRSRTEVENIMNMNNHMAQQLITTRKELIAVQKEIFRNS